MKKSKHGRRTKGDPIALLGPELWTKMVDFLKMYRTLWNAAEYVFPGDEKKQQIFMSEIMLLLDRLKS